MDKDVTRGNVPVQAYRRGIAVGQLVTFVFTTAGRGSVRHRSYAQGEVMKIGSRLSIKVLDDPRAHEYWRKAHVGKIKVVGHSAVIDDLPGSADAQGDA